MPFNFLIRITSINTMIAHPGALHHEMATTIIDWVICYLLILILFVLKGHSNGSNAESLRGNLCPCDLKLLIDGMLKMGVNEKLLRLNHPLY